MPTFRSTWWRTRGVFARGAAMPESVAGALGRPADVLIAPSGRIIASHYGRPADDQWSFDRMLALAARRDEAPAITS